MSERKPTCPVCGGHEFYEISRVDIKQRITSWDTDETPAEYEIPEEILWDSCETLDRPYQCAGCNEYDLTTFDLFPEE